MGLTEDAGSGVPAEEERKKREEGREKTRRDSEKSTALDDGSNGLGRLAGWLGAEKNLRKV